MSVRNRHGTLRRWTRAHWKAHDHELERVRKLDLSACSPLEKRLIDFAYLGGGPGWSEYQRGSDARADTLLCIVLNTVYRLPWGRDAYCAFYDYDWDAFKNASLGFTQIHELSGDRRFQIEVQIPIDDPADAERLLVPVLKKHAELILEAHARNLEELEREAKPCA